MAYPINHTGVSKRQMIFNSFHDSGLHPRNNEGERVEWPKKTYCVFQVMYNDNDNKEQFIVESTNDSHAEIKMMDTLKRFTNLEGEISIYINYTPCSNCANRLIKFVSDLGWRMHLVIYFVQLYNVRRESRQEENIITMEESETNKKYLRKLAQYVTLSNFTEQQWDELAALLNVRNTAGANRQEEDIKVSSLFSQVLDMQRVTDAFLYSQYNYKHDDGTVEYAERPLFIILKERIVKFGGGYPKTFVFESEHEALQFLKVVPYKDIEHKNNVILHMTRSPTVKFINDLVKLARNKNTSFYIPFTKLHATCTTTTNCSIYDREHDDVIKKHYHRFPVDGVCVKKYFHFYKNRLRGCLVELTRKEVSELYKYLPGKDICLKMILDDNQS